MRINKVILSKICNTYRKILWEQQMEHLKMTNENFLRNRGNIYWTFRIYKDLDYIYYVLSIVGIVVGQYAIYKKSKICLINKNTNWKTVGKQRLVAYK